jgi:hypothetical protein
LFWILLPVTTLLRISGESMPSTVTWRIAKMDMLKKTLASTEKRPSVSLDCEKNYGFLELTGPAAGYPAGTILLGVEEGAEFGFTFSDKHGAVVPSIRGVNPLTGLKASIDPWTSSRGDFCPKDPSHGRLGLKGECKACGHQWASTNYLSCGWHAKLPGWRIGEDKFRPFVATSEMIKDVAAALDPSAAVPALGFAFYPSKNVPYQYNPFYWYSTPRLPETHYFYSPVSYNDTQVCFTSTVSRNSMDVEGSLTDLSVGLRTSASKR